MELNKEYPEHNCIFYKDSKCFCLKRIQEIYNNKAPISKIKKGIFLIDDHCSHYKEKKNVSKR
jgi:hypothetical protein